MTNISIRELQDDEAYSLIFQFGRYAFQPSPPFGNREEVIGRLKRREGAFYYGLFEDSVPAAIIGGTPFIQNIRGIMRPMGGVFEVITMPAHRRKGYTRRNMAHILNVFREREMPVSCLYPFKESFYERMGYVSFPQPYKAVFAVSTLTPLLKKDFDGEVEMVLSGDGYDTYRDFMFRLQINIHGMGLFFHNQKADAQHRNSSWIAFARVDGEVVGVMIYRLKDGSITEMIFEASRFYYSTPAGKYLLLEWIARHINQAAQAEIWLPPFEQPAMWLSDIRPKLEPVFFAPMGRIVDITKLNGIPAGPGSFSAHMSDPLCTWNEGMWQFESVDGFLQVAPAKTATSSLTIQGLSALIYGTHDPGDYSIRGWGNPPPSDQLTMREMFPIQLPFLHDIF